MNNFSLKTTIIFVLTVISLHLSTGTSHAGLSFILRDEHGVPHIYSLTNKGLFFGLGYANAQDRLYQLEMFKRAYKGRLSEVLGGFYLFPDKMFLTAGYSHDEIQASYDALDDEYKTVLVAYTDGINKYIREALADRAKKLPYEFHKNGFDPEEWSPLDIVVFSSQMLKSPRGGKDITCAEILADLVEQHGEEVGNQIFDDLIFLEDPDAPTSVPSSEGGAPSFFNNNKRRAKVNSAPIENIRKIARLFDQKAKRFEEYSDLLAIPPWGEPPWTHSQELAISPSRSTTGNAIFLGGPQLVHAIPSGFYEVGLHGPGINAVGNTMSGIPAIVFGHTGSTTFTLTAGTGNSEDFFIETLNPDNPDQYWYNNAWQDMDIRTEIIPVKDSQPETLVIKYTVHGPVMQTDIESNQAYTLKWANRDTPQNLFVALYDAMKAKNISEFQTALNKFPLQYNFLYADKHGNIGYFHVGNFPVRSPLVDVRLPIPGTGEYEWQGFIPDAEKPFSINPEQGYLANWNNKPEAGWLQGDRVIDHPWGIGCRLYRYDELMAVQEKFSLEDLKNISFEVSMKDLNAPLFKTFLLEAESSEINDSRITTAKHYLEEWNDFRVDDDEDGKYDSPGVAIWDAWWVNVLKNTFEDELGAHYVHVSKESKGVYRYGAPLFLRALLGDSAGLPPSRDYFNGERDEILLASLLKALDDLQTKFGTPDMSHYPFFFWCSHQ